MKRTAFALALSALLAAGAARCNAAGAWSTFLRPSGYGDLIASTDTVWCATEDAGLLVFRRSAAQFSTYSREPGKLASNNLTCLAFDRGGRMWIGTSDAGVSRLSSDGSWGVLNAYDGLPGLSVNALRTEGDSLWIGTTAGLALFDGTEITGRLPDGAAPSPFLSNDITGVALTGDSVWVSTGAGVYYGLRSSRLTTWTRMPAGLPLGRVDALASDGVGVWALASNQLWLADAGSVWTQVPGWGAVYRVSDHFGRLLVSTNTGVFALLGGAWSLISGSPPSNGAPFSTFAATTDPTGSAFAASHSGLLEQLGPGVPWQLHFPPGPPGNDIQNVLLDGSRVYVATFDQGIGRMDGVDWTLWPPVPCSSNCDYTFNFPIYAFAMLKDQAGKKWVGCWSFALDRMNDYGPVDTVTHVIVPITSSDIQHTWLWSSAADSSGGVWFGGDTNALGSTRPEDQPIGIDYYSPSGILKANYQPGTANTIGTMGSVQVRSLEYSATRDQIWVGYAGHGVQWFQLPRLPSGAPDTTGATIQLRTLTDASRLDVFAVIPHSDSIWVFNTNDLRLYTGYGASNSSVAYSIPAGPAPRGAIHPLEVAADGTVWLGTANGVRVYHPGGATENFNTANSPLANDEVRTVRLDRTSGAVWIATATGLNRYDPNYVAPPAAPLPFLQARVYPNPVPIANLIGTSLRITGNSPSYGGRVYGVDGRMVRRLAATADGDLLWDGRDENGQLVLPGLYFVRLDAGGRQATARVTVLR